MATRKIISKKDMISMEADPAYEQIRQKYNNPKIDQKFNELLGSVLSSSFEIIDFDTSTGKPTEWDGQPVPIINDIVKQELSFFILSI